MIGFKNGATFEFLEPNAGLDPSDPQYVCIVRLSQFGNNKSYSWKKATEEFDYIYSSDTRASSKIEIRNVCKGPLLFHTTQLYDDSLLRVSPVGRS
jgi:hypothetical protein